jgi:hypothetical protein
MAETNLVFVDEMFRRLIHTLKRLYLHRKLKKQQADLKWLRGIPQDNQL